MTKKEKELLEDLKEHISVNFKGYCIYILEQIKDDKNKTRIVIHITLLDATNFRLPAMELSVDNLYYIAACLESNRNKIMELQD